MRLVTCLAGSLLTLSFVPALADTVIRMDRPEPYELRVEGFELSGAAEVRIEAIGLSEARGGWWIERLWRDDAAPLNTYAWILDARTRRPVWAMDRDDSSRVTGNLLRAETSLTLDAGRYELYLFSGNAWAAQQLEEPDDDRSDESWWERFHDRRRRLDDLLEDLESCSVELAIRGVPQRAVKRFEVDGALPGALIARARLGDSAYGVDGFRLDRPTRLRIYGLIEQREQDRDASDSSWIVRADTREVVFDASRTRTRRGGGGEKNRVIDTEIELEPGRYLLYHGTDDSHSFQSFNVAAPWDPYNWGVTLLPGEGFAPEAFGIFEPFDPPALIDLGGIGDSRTVEQAFRLDADARLWIEALGEWDTGDETFYDSAWIIDASTGATVWEMTERNTRGAGGAAKNRMFDGLVALPRGSYVLYYATDGSHAYPHWNAATPYRPEAWGVTLRAAPETDLAGFVLLDEQTLLEASGFLVRLVGVGDDARERRRFTLESPARLRVHAVGEGQSGRMYDYAYIVDDRTGSTVWEMDYDATRHAGGADKNRVVDDEIALDPGAYEVIYVSDGSHSSAGWNSAPPRQPNNWGVTLRRL